MPNRVFGNPSWYARRLSAMEPAEILWRAGSLSRLPGDWVRWKRNAEPPVADWRPFCASCYPIQLQTCGKTPNSIRCFDIEFPTGTEFDWHFDYRYKRPVKRGFAETINIRDTAVVGDIKYVWELSRHQHLSVAAHSEHGAREAPYIIRSIESWLRQNPYLDGVHWTSSLELAERLISWSLLYPRIATAVARAADFRKKWLASIYRHMERIAGRLSLYSSANNHLIGELVGLYIGSICFDFWPECARWRAQAMELLEREIRLQVAPDGVNREQAVSYHLFVFELLLLGLSISRRSNTDGTAFSAAFSERLEAMGVFLDAVATTRGDLPWYGDSDDARGFLLSEEDSALETTMQLAGLLFDRPSWLRFKAEPTAATRALRPDWAETANDCAAPVVAATRELFPDAGLACVRSDDESVLLVMDFGPLGYGSTAAHGHADALSVWWAIDGTYFLVDAGTYAYHSHPDWRTYFRGTSAHNTARVDATDQSEMTGRFLWGAKASARLCRFEKQPGRTIIEAEHDGYRRLPDPVIHQRRVCFDRRDGSLDLQDSFLCGGKHEIELFFHLHEDSEILSLSPGELRVAWHGRLIVFSSTDRIGRWEIVRASEYPKLGWRSCRFNEKREIPTLRISACIDGQQTIHTFLRISL